MMRYTVEIIEFDPRPVVKPLRVETEFRFRLGKRFQEEVRQIRAIIPRRHSIDRITHAIVNGVLIRNARLAARLRVSSSKLTIAQDLAGHELRKNKASRNRWRKDAGITGWQR